MYLLPRLSRFSMGSWRLWVLTSSLPISPLSASLNFHVCLSCPLPLHLDILRCLFVFGGQSLTETSPCIFGKVNEYVRRFFYIDRPNFVGPVSPSGLGYSEAASLQRGASFFCFLILISIFFSFTCISALFWSRIGIGLFLLEQAIRYAPNKCKLRCQFIVRSWPSHCLEPRGLAPSSCQEKKRYIYILETDGSFNLSWERRFHTGSIAG